MVRWKPPINDHLKEHDTSILETYPTNSLLFTKQTVWNCWNEIEKEADQNYLVNLLLVSGKVVGVGPNHVEKLEISLLSSSSFHLRLFYQSEHLFLNIFEQDLQPYEVKRVSCVPSRTPGRALRSHRQCTGSPAGLFMIKGEWHTVWLW